ncbi:MAG: YvaD family protein [Archangiaceae bacterium]|nr:YvaD family protein [Archangiaceae bacterium]
MEPRLPRGLPPLMLLTDVGFIIYWVVTGLHLLPPEWLYRDASNALMVDWNWSFLSLDLLVSATGLSGLHLARRGARAARGLVIVSLTLTSASGLMALSFWVLRRDFDLGWWLPNVFLLVYPVPYLVRLLRE